jgi:8-oxo-dGTP pyrophosphatase MutT (NUDIX family)
MQAFYVQNPDRTLLIFNCIYLFYPIQLRINPTGVLPLKQAAAICYRFKNDSAEYLLVRTLSKKWTFPKGTVEHGEDSWAAAQREAFEEAGVTGVIAREALTTYLHSKTAWEDDILELRVQAFLLEVNKTQTPGESYRNPAWFSFGDAEKALIEGRGFKYAEELRRVLHEADKWIACSLNKVKC